MGVKTVPTRALHPIMDRLLKRRARKRGAPVPVPDSLPTLEMLKQLVPFLSHCSSAMDASAALLSSPFPSFQLRWSPSEHPALWHSFHASLKQGLFVDVTLMAAPKNKDREIIDPVNVDDDDDDEDEAGGEEGVKAHQLLLSAVSPFFRNILLEQRHTAHPIIILPAGIPLRDVRYLLEFVYGGKVMVPKEQLLSVLKTAAQLEIKGLSGELGAREGTFIIFSSFKSQITRFSGLNESSTMTLAIIGVLL